MTRRTRRLLAIVSILCAVLGPPPLAHGQSGELRFERIVIDDDFPGGYQVEVADVNGDGKSDLVALGGSTVAWYENPGWTKRIITGPEQAPAVISSATADLDGDGKAEVAIAFDFAMNEPKRGKLGLAIQGEQPDDPWTFHTVADVPSIHRVRWGDLDGDGTPELVVAPIFGPEATPPAYHSDPAQIRFFRTGDDPKSGRWAGKVEAVRPVIHAIAVKTIAGDDMATILTADNRGVGSLGGWSMIGGGMLSMNQANLVPGAPGEPPKVGCSEVHLGHMADGRFLLATLEPWHGNEVVVYVGIEPGRLDFGPRTVLDDTLDAGHALWVADVDGDGNDEVFAGHRGKDHRVSAYRFNGESWDRTVIDRDIAAQDLRGGDLDGDGVPDVVAIGGSTRNVVWYRPIRPEHP